MMFLGVMDRDSDHRRPRFPVRSDGGAQGLQTTLELLGGYLRVQTLGAPRPDFDGIGTRYLETTTAVEV